MPSVMTDAHAVSSDEDDIPLIALDDGGGCGIDILINERRWCAVLDAAVQKRLLQAVRICLNEVKKRTGFITLLLTDDAEMARLNAQFRGRNAPTNVLSFPDEEERNLGDIALAWGVVKAESAESNTPLADHILHLVIHGVLHLLGFDHSTDDDAVIMESLEAGILGRFDITDPYDSAPNNFTLNNSGGF